MLTCIRRFLALALLAVIAFPADAAAVTGTIPEPDPVQRTWMRTDHPVAMGSTERTWMWGPLEDGYQTRESYAESPGGERTVTYFDKSRMEVTHPAGDRRSDWYVTNGLLVVELMTGRLQLGDVAFEERYPAEVNIAGDPDDIAGPTYATFAMLRDLPVTEDTRTITTRVDRSGSLVDDPMLAAFAVRTGQRVTVPGIDHYVAAPFWDFMQSSGTVYDRWEYISDRLFPNPFYATGFPVTEAYWARVKVAGVYQDVLMQCFERRCLTYTPGNEPEWRVEAGNVGLHYHLWRYGSERPDPQRLQVTFNLYHEQSFVASTVTTETFFGSLAAGTWETRAPDGELLSHGALWAEHSLLGIEAVVVQDWPRAGWGTLVFRYRISIGGLTGDGEFDYVVTSPSGVETGVVSLAARFTASNTLDVTLSELPPVLFTAP
jgi:hypothetical protein